VYVQAFPATGSKWQISARGGTLPYWRRDGKELFFLAPDQKVMAALVKTGATFEPGTPQELFGLDATAGSFEPSPAGQRFLVNVPAGGETATPPLTVVLNWQAGLKK
jgi:hypothetical protein